MPTPLPMTCFKAYDIRGRLGEDLDGRIARRIGRAFGQILQARRVVLGRDCRASSAVLSRAVAEGLMACGCEVLELGLCGTEEVYFATAHLGADGGICVTASHNPVDFNGMKMVQRGAAPIGMEGGLGAIRDLAASGDFAPDRAGGKLVDVSGTRAAYVEHVLGFLDLEALRPMKVLVNAGNGSAGPTFDAIAEALAEKGAPLEFMRLHHTPDGTFPNGIPNPLLPENRPVTADAVIDAGADLGVAWDGDFDRCFLFDAEGGFVPGEYIVGLLAELFLAKEPGATIVHDPRIIWNTQDVLARAGGKAVVSRTGHALIKQVMRDSGAVYGGEMSAHHYFRDFMCCDSGMIPWLLVVELMARRDVSLKDLIAARKAAFPSSGEINFRVDDVPAALARIEAAFGPAAEGRDDLDGLSLDFGCWRFNLRTSNTEPLLRLNVESRGDAGLVADKVAALTAVIEAG